MSFRTISALRLVLLTSCALGVLFGLSAHVNASESGPDWISGPITLEVVGDKTWADGDRFDLSSEKEYVTAKEHTGPWFDPTDANVSLYATQTMLGAFAYDHVLPLGWNRWQKLDTYGSYDSYVPNPATAGLLVLKDNNNFYAGAQKSIEYTNNWMAYFGNISTNLRGDVTRKPNGVTDKKLVLPNGGGVVQDSWGGSARFSQNGNWLFINTTNGQTRVDVGKFEALYFAPMYNGAYGSSAQISNSGRYVAVMTGYNALNMYDLSRCEAEKTNYSQRNCEKRSLYDFAKSEYAKTLEAGNSLGDLRPIHLTFVNESTIEVLASVLVNSGYKYVTLRLHVDPGVQTTRYLALGDSFSSGEGALSYRAGTNFYVDDTNYNLCHQSTVSYPYLLNKTLAPEWFGDVACSGAVTGDVISSDEKAYRVNSSQAHGLEVASYDEHILGNVLPGYRTQLSFISRYKPSVATISIGGNDIGFGDIVTQCVTQKYTLGGDCFADSMSRDWLASTIDQKIPILTSTLRTLKNSLSGDQRLYVVGYPQVVNPASSTTVCSLNVQMIFAERTFASNLIDYLNEAIALAAENVGARYVDVSNAFYDSDKDYRLCGNQTLTAVNGLIADLPVDDPTKYILIKKPYDKAYSESYHPNALGHILLARQIKAMTNNLSTSMPDPTPSQTMKVSDALRTKLVGYSTSAYDYKVHVKQEVVDSLIAPNTSLSVKIDTSTLLPPRAGSNAIIEIHSTPTTLGEVPIDPIGITNTTIVIPTSVPIGPHELHIYYTDVSGVLVDIYQYVYVVHDLIDFDGDGIVNAQEECLLVPASGVDSDNDGIDDACDGEYSKVESSSPALEGITLIKQAEVQGVISKEEARITLASSEEITNNRDELSSKSSGAERVLGKASNGNNIKRDAAESEYTKQIGISIALLLLSAGGIYFYKHYKHNLNHKGSPRE